MKKLILAVIVLLVVAIASIWLIPCLKLRHTYYQTINELAPNPYSVIEMDDAAKTLLVDVFENWGKIDYKGEGSVSEGFSMVGTRPSVSNLIQLLNHRPDTFFLSEEDASIGCFQALLMPIPPIDGAIHLSADGQIALFRLHTDTVLICQNEDGEVRESLYSRKYKSNQSTHSITGSAGSE